MRVVLMLMGLTLLTVGCYQTSHDDDLSAIPTTNNPNLIPERPGPIPQQMPY